MSNELNEEWIINPKTGRAIKKGSRTYRILKESGALDAPQGYEEDKWLPIEDDSPDEKMVDQLLAEDNDYETGYEESSEDKYESPDEYEEETPLDDFSEDSYIEDEDPVNDYISQNINEYRGINVDDLNDDAVSRLYKKLMS